MTGTTRRVAVQWGAVLLGGLLSGVRLLDADSTPWVPVAAFAAAGALLVGPVAWAVRTRFDPDERERLGYGGWALVFAAPIPLAFVVLAGGIRLLDAAVFGGACGVLAMGLVELTVLPPTYRGTLTNRDRTGGRDSRAGQ